MTDPASTETQLARFVADVSLADIPDEVLHEARRSLVNIFATTLAGCREPAIDTLMQTMTPFAGEPTATLIGRSERTDAALAACINAAAANIFDFDDTHEATIIHPASTAFAPLFAVAETRRVSGADLLRGFVLGAELTCRIGLAISPGHYARGWHITSTSGVFGGATGVGAMLGLSPAQMIHAWGAAAVQSSGMVEALGTAAKSLSVGGAARGGLLAALLAKDGLAGPLAPLTGERGFLNVYADEPKPELLLAGLGEVWELAANTHKPYPVGVVLNPVIEAVLQLREEHGLSLETLRSIELTGHPLLLQRTDRAEVTRGRETQVSAQHAIAIALLRGQAGLDAFSDEAASETLRVGRPQVDFVDDSTRAIASVRVVAHTHDGAELQLEIDAARGSRENPLSDRQLEEKLIDAAARSRWTGDSSRLIDALWRIEDHQDASDIVRLAAGP
jgi:2-methylcitrate dehydratase PrpD